MLTPTVWGPQAWIFLHSITLDYPECPSATDKNNIKTFFLTLQNVLPCKSCENNFKLHLQQFPLTDKILSSKETLVKWLIDIHNEVNKQNNKKVVSYDEVLKHYYNMYSYENNNYSYILLICILIVIIITFSLLFILYQRTNTHH